MSPREGQTEYVVMCPTDSNSPHSFRYIRNVLWGSGFSELVLAVRRVQPNHLVFTVRACNELFHNVGDWSKLKA